MWLGFAVSTGSQLWKLKTIVYCYSSYTVGFIEIIVEFLYNVLKTLEFNKKFTVFIVKVCLIVKWKHQIENPYVDSTKLDVCIIRIDWLNAILVKQRGTKQNGTALHSFTINPSFFNIESRDNRIDINYYKINILTRKMRLVSVGLCYYCI